MPGSWRTRVAVLAVKKATGAGNGAVAPAAACGMSNRWPTSSVAALMIPLASRRAWTVAPYRRAIESRLSPERTLYASTGTTAAGTAETAGVAGGRALAAGAGVHVADGSTTGVGEGVAAGSAETVGVAGGLALAAGTGVHVAVAVCPAKTLGAAGGRALAAGAGVHVADGRTAGAGEVLGVGLCGLAARLVRAGSAVNVAAGAGVIVLTAIDTAAGVTCGSRPPDERCSIT